MFALCRRLLINRFHLIVWVLVLLINLVAEMYVHRAQFRCEGIFKNITSILTYVYSAIYSFLVLKNLNCQLRYVFC